MCDGEQVPESTGAQGIRGGCSLAEPGLPCFWCLSEPDNVFNIFAGPEEAVLMGGLSI